MYHLVEAYLMMSMNESISAAIPKFPATQFATEFGLTSRCRRRERRMPPLPKYPLASDLSDSEDWSGGCLLCQSDSPLLILNVRQSKDTDQAQPEWLLIAGLCHVVAY